MNRLPKHGTLERVERFSCDCVACTKQIPTESRPRWPLKPLIEKYSLEIITLWAKDKTLRARLDVKREPNPLNFWRLHGLSDRDADVFTVSIGLLPYEVWSGYLTAGIDYA